MTKRLLSLLLLGCTALFIVASPTVAQVRADGSIYLAARVGLGMYSGDVDQNPSNELATFISDGGLAFGGEIGYQFSPSLAVGLAYFRGSYPVLEDARSGVGAVLNDGTAVQELQVRLRYVPFAKSRISPYVNMGLAATLSTPADLDDKETAFAPIVGLGVDLMLGRRLSLFIEGDWKPFVPDLPIDNCNPGENPLNTNCLGSATGDDADFDILAFAGLGLRYTFKEAIVPVDALIDGPMALESGQNGTFTATVNPDATGPCAYTWNWGDGTTSTGLVASHSYAAPGTYTVTFSAACAANTDVETMVVTVTAPPPPPVQAPVLANCTASPATAGIGQPVRFSATSTGTQPVSFRYDFGDGATANTVSATHSFASAGVYTVTLTASNEAGSDQCTIVVTVADTFCAEVSELNNVLFGFNSSTLNPEANGRLDENIAVLQRCPELCVIVNGYTDDVEGNKVALSTRRADAVKAYYMARGIDASRIQVRGLGEAPDANNKEDPGPGDRNARRADSVPTECSAMGGN